MDSKQDKLLLSVKQAADALGIGINQAYNLVRAPGFPALKIGSRYLISKTGLEAWIEEQIQNRS